MFQPAEGDIRKESLSNRQPIALTIDAGSSRFKTNLYDISTLNLLSNQAERVIDYTKWETRDNYPGAGLFKHVHGDVLRYEIHRSVEKLLRDNQTPDLAAVVVTGRSNNLVVYNTKGETPFQLPFAKKPKTIILTDDPSLQTKSFTPEQVEILKRYIPTFDEKIGLKPASAINKLIALMNNPSLIEYLFGREVRFSDLRFNSWLGFIAETFSGDLRATPASKIRVVPVPDIPSFGHADLGGTQISSLIHELGVNEEQVERISFAEDETIIETAETEPSQDLVWYTAKDLTANAYLIHHCIFDALPSENRLPQDAHFFETDSVGKDLFVATSDEEKQIGKEVSGLRYDIQRITGNVNLEIRELLKRYLLSAKETDFYSLVNEILSKGLTETDNPYFYFPDLATSGVLIKKEKDGFRVIILPLSDTNEFNRTEMEKIARAMVRGVCFGFREKAEKVYKARNQTTGFKFYIYGGLAYNSGPWRQTFTQCLPRETYHLYLPNACLSALFKYVKERQLTDPERISHFTLTTERLPKTMDREEEYKQWLDIYQNQARVLFKS